MIKKGVLFVLLLGTLLLPVSMKRVTQGVRFAKMQIDLPFHPEWETPTDGIEEFLSQKFHFLGKGAQCYVFASTDGKTVLKIFRFDQKGFIHQKPKNRNVLRMMKASKLAYSSAKEETGLLFLHLNLTEKRLPTAVCTDPIGRRLKIPLDKVRFALQKRGEPFRKSLLSSGPRQMEKKIDSFLSLLEGRTGKGIGNSDPNLSRNFGFSGDKAMEFDFGNYYLLGQTERRQEIQRYIGRLRRWLKREAPSWVSYLDEKEHSLLNRI